MDKIKQIEAIKDLFLQCVESKLYSYGYTLDSAHSYAVIAACRACEALLKGAVILPQ